MSETVRIRPWPRHLTVCSSIFTVALGLTVLVGWYFHVSALVQFQPQLPPMVRNSAACFVLCGVAQLLVALRSSRWLVVWCTGIVSAVSILTIVEYVFHLNAGIDELLGPSYIAVSVSNPGRMAPVTATCFALGSMGLLLAPKILSKRSALFLGLNGSIIAAVGMATIMAFVLGSSDAFGWGNFTRESAPTAVGFLVFGLGILALVWHVESDPRGTPRWLPICVAIGVATCAMGLWQALIAEGHAPFALLPVVVLCGGGLIAPIFGLTVYLAQRAYAQAAALRRSEAFLAQAQELTLTGSLWWKLSTGEMTWSEENFRLMEYPRTITPSIELIMNRCHPEDLSFVQETVARSGREGTNMDFEHRLLMPDGSLKHIHVVMQSAGLESGKREFVGAMTDITERKSAEEELRRSKAYLAEAQKLSLTGSFGWDVSADEHFWSEETFRIFEYDLSTKITLQLILERVHPQDLQLVRETIAEAAGRDFDYECRLLMPGGFVKHAHIVARAINSKSGLREFVGAVMDITATRGAEEALRRAQADLAHVSRITTLGELTASIAHEVNQPLGSVINNANACLSLLPSGTPQLDEVREALEEIIEGTDRASTVISRVRQLARKVPYERMLVNLGDVVADVLVLARYEAATRQVTIRTDLTEDLPSVWGDRVQLQQVLLNLVVNGMDAMNTVEVSKRILIISGRCEKRDGETACLLSVQDAGTGFKPEEKDRLFEAFYTTKSEGMGMGLAISRSIIEAHGGRLWAETKQGSGATFQFSLPDALNAKL